MSLTAAAVIAAVEEFHRAAEAWFGPAPQEADLARMAKAVAAEFTWFGPDGSAASRAATLARIQAARGSHARDAPPFRIVVEEPTLRWAANTRALATYIERQSWNGQVTRRRALAGFRLDPSNPSALLWTEVAETWIAG